MHYECSIWIQKHFALGGFKLLQWIICYLSECRLIYVENSTALARDILEYIWTHHSIVRFVNEAFSSH